MFWDAVGTGLMMFAQWQTYIAAGLFLSLALAPALLVGLVTSRAGVASLPIGCLSVLIMPFFQAFALLVFVLTLSPLMLGTGADASWSLPWRLLLHSPWFVAKILGVMLVVAVVLALIPLVGQLHTLHALASGAVALAVVVVMIEGPAPSRKIAMWPGWWFGLGLLAIGTMLAFIGTIVAAIVVTAVDAKAEGLGQLIAFPLVAPLGFIPLFIYAAWLGAQVRTL